MNVSQFVARTRKAYHDAVDAYKACCVTLDPTEYPSFRRFLADSVQAETSPIYVTGCDFIDVERAIEALGATAMLAFDDTVGTAYVFGYFRLELDVVSNAYKMSLCLELRANRVVYKLPLDSDTTLQQWYKDIQQVMHAVHAAIVEDDGNA